MAAGAWSCFGCSLPWGVRSANLGRLSCKLDALGSDSCKGRRKACQHTHKLFGEQNLGSLILDLRACAGNFFSAAFEDTCIALVGASGGVFGMVGLFIADMIVNFSYIKRRALSSKFSSFQVFKFSITCSCCVLCWPLCIQS